MRVGAAHEVSGLALFMALAHFSQSESRGEVVYSTNTRVWAAAALILALWSASLGLLCAQNPANETPKGDERLPTPQLLQPAPSTGLLDGQSAKIDLPSALRLAGVQNPEILLAQQRVEEAAALRQLAAAQFLPSLNVGTDTDIHTGPLQRSTGQIIQENRGSLYLGLGAAAVGAGTVNIPGLVWSGNVSDTIYANLVARQHVQERQFANQAARNDVLLRVAAGYLELMRGEGRLAVAIKNREEAVEVARITADFAKTGQGRQADADRAATDMEQRDSDMLNAEGAMAIASARLAQLLSLDPATRLQAADAHVVPVPIVPDPIPLAELLTIAVTQRPELRERQAAIRAALLELDGAKLLPFSPNVILGYSTGTFGGGSNLVAQGITQPDGSVLQQNRFGNFGDRQDVDAVVYWSLRNLGVGNLALIRLANSDVRSQRLREVEVLDRIGAEVAAAHAKVHARFAQIGTNEHAVQASQSAFVQDLLRARNNLGLPIEVLDSMRLLGRSRYAYLDAIVDYNTAQFELYVALGQPPADFLARPAPVTKAK
jgi:outer membrane protein TolC